MRLAREMASRNRKSLWVLSLLLLFQLNACKQTSTEDDDTTNTFVRVIDMSSRAADGDTGDDLFSDVCIGSNDDPPTCTVVNDDGIVVLEGQPKDLSQLQSPVQDVIFYRYRVTYIRADGQNVPGVDVPYPFDGAANFRVPVDGTQVTREFMVVRQQAKLESPLSDLAFGGGQGVLSTIAQIEFFGRDVAGRELKVTGTLNITFADFGDS